MKRFRRWAVLLMLVLMLVLPQAGVADDFFDTIDSSVTTDSHTGISSIDTKINGAKITGSWYDSDLNGDLDDGEMIINSVMIYDRNGSLALESAEGVEYKDQLETWAEDNAETILGIIFPGGIEDATGITSDAILTQATFNKKMFKKAMPDIQQEAALSNFKGALEYQHLDVDGNSGNAYSLIMGYTKNLESGYELGITVPYRYADLSDSIDTKSHYLGMDLYGKKPIKEWDDMELSVGGELFGSITYVKSDAIEHLGSLKYGAGVFTSFVKELTKGAVSFGLDVKVSDAYLPSSLADDDNTYVSKAIEYVNDLDLVTTITYGVNYGIPFMDDTMAINFEVIRSNYISDDIDSRRNASTIAGVYYSYYPTDSFSLDVGIHNTFELEDVDVLGFVLGAVYKF